MNLIKPKRLKTGDTIGLISLSGNREQSEKTERAKNYFYNKMMRETYKGAKH